MTGLSAPHTASGQLQRACLDVLMRYEAAGELPTSTRFVYYQLKQDGYPLKKHAVRRHDSDVIDAVMRLRDADLVPWGWIIDETRSVAGVHLASSIRQWLLEELDEARVNPWEGQHRPVVICESRGVRAALRATVRRYGALVTSTNGQVGGFLRTDVAPLLAPGSPVAYFGDWNKAGSDIERNTRTVLERAVHGEMAWKRLAVTTGQAETAGLPPKPDVVRGRHHGVSYEAEALGAAELNRLLAGWLDDLQAEPLDDVLEREAAEREQLRVLLDGEAR